MFRVSALDRKNPPIDENGNLDFKKDFFGKETNLTVSGQLEAEAYALGLGEVYTFGPTFRAENSNTKRHLAEFWMIEPEMAFYDLNDNMDLAEKFITQVLSEVLSNCVSDLEFLNDRQKKEDLSKPLSERNQMNLLDKIKFVVENNFIRITVKTIWQMLASIKKNHAFEEIVFSTTIS